jgi:hypothetical protein
MSTHTTPPSWLSRLFRSPICRCSTPEGDTSRTSTSITTFHPRQPIVVQLVLWFKTAPVVGGPMTPSHLAEEDRSRLSLAGRTPVRRKLAAKPPSGCSGRTEAGRKAEARGDVEPGLLRLSLSALPDEPIDQAVHQGYRLYLTDREVNS